MSGLKPEEIPENKKGKQYPYLPTLVDGEAEVGPSLMDQVEEDERAES